MSEEEDFGSTVSFGSEPLIDASDNPDEITGPAPEDLQQQQAVPYKEKCFLSTISFKTPDPLNNENWVAWKGQIMPMLELNGVWTHCDRAEEAPPPEEKEQCKEWDTAERVMQILILNNLSVAQFVHVLEVATVKQVWDNLKAVHEHCGQQSITAIRCTLYQTCAQDGDNIVAHLMGMRTLQVQLHHMGLRVPNKDFTNILVSSLLKSWDPFTMSYLGSQTGTKVLTSQEFIVIVNDECNQRKVANGSTDGMETVLTAQSSKCPAKKKKAAKKEKGKRACFTCGRNNYLTRDSFFKGKQKCANCSHFNHETSKCRSTAKGKEQEKETQLPKACLPKMGNTTR